MNCVVKYRVAGSDNDWAYAEEGSKRRCLEYVQMRESEDDLEYVIYEKVDDGVCYGYKTLDEINKELHGDNCNFENEEEVLNYFDDLIDKWHDGDSNESLIEYLGLSRVEYNFYVTNPTEFAKSYLNKEK